MPESPFEYEVAISFAGEQRPEAAAIADHLRKAGVTVFFDEYVQADLWGKNLYDHLAEVYGRKARYCLMLVSAAYAAKVWTNHERQNAQARALAQKGEYILPVRFDETEISALPATVGYVRYHDHGAQGICALLLRKLQGGGAAVWSLAPAPPELDLSQFWAQRKRLPDTEIMKKIWSKPRWRIWIVPTEYRKARFQNVEGCRQFVSESYVRIQDWHPFPWCRSDGISTGDEWVAGEVDLPETKVSHLERWVLFRSGQFVYHRCFNEMPQLSGRIHALEVLDMTTGAFEFAARLAGNGMLSPGGVVEFEMFGVDGGELIWPQDLFGHRDAVPTNCWCQVEQIAVERIVSGDFGVECRELALQVAREIYAKFGWTDPPTESLASEQIRRFGASLTGAQAGR